jgi:UDP-MurNAc hydroxylase
MKIQFLGHAGFLVETDDTVILCDPWLSETGAFDGAWFQYPCNHHLANTVQDVFEKSNKQKFIYISHEHKDHYDLSFLLSLKDLDFQFILPKFNRNVLHASIIEHFTQNIFLVYDDNLFQMGSCNITIFIDDNELNRDSAILIQWNQYKFLNLNDCKIYDRLPKIKKENGDIDLLAVQFSGATWHPTCYDYDAATYSKISKKKILSKFELVAKAIEWIQPKYYIPSAGPACFLDPDLIHINFQETNIFPKADLFEEYLKKRNKGNTDFFTNLNPGDKLDIAKGTIKKDTENAIITLDFVTYIENYATKYEDFFAARKKKVDAKTLEVYWHLLIEEFTQKLLAFKGKEQIKRSLYVQLFEKEYYFIKIDFQKDVISVVEKINEIDHYLLKIHVYDISLVLDKKMTWEDFSLTFRMQLNREPDIYQVLMQGFLILETEDLERFCNHITAIENRTERITLEVQGCKMTVDRYCPHQGADLKNGWIEEDRYLVCPRHGWRYDLTNEGNCISNDACIHAINLEEFL